MIINGVHSSRTCTEYLSKAKYHIVKHIYDNDFLLFQDNHVNPGVYNGLAAFAEKLLRKPPSALKDYANPSASNVSRYLGLIWDLLLIIFRPRLLQDTFFIHILELDSISKVSLYKICFFGQN